MRSMWGNIKVGGEGEDFKTKNFSINIEEQRT